jgi:hypothetical protein
VRWGSEPRVERCGRLLCARGDRRCNRRVADRGYQFPASDRNWHVPLLYEVFKFGWLRDRQIGHSRECRPVYAASTNQ